ncbi:MAG: hypothetical protein KBE09_03235 [Candidatus Pacebacteria bacterium]|nr:hypothetical protein [Candidatus Paceibacterota bacterium]
MAQVSSKAASLVTIAALVFAGVPFHFADAARVANSATVDGSSFGTFEAGESIAATFSVSTNDLVDNDNWESSAWRIGGIGGYTCVNHGDHTTDGTYSETFGMNAPGTPGLYSAEFIAYSDDSCSTGASATLTLTSAIEVVEPFADTFDTSDDFSFAKWEDPTGIDDTNIVGSASGSDGSRNGNAANKFAKMGSDDEYICASVNASGYTGLELSYFWKTDTDADGVSDKGFVEYKGTGLCTDTTGWSTIASHDIDAGSAVWSSQVVHDISALDNSSFLIRFRNDANASDEHFRVDDVVVRPTAVATGSLTIVKDATPNSAQDFAFTTTGSGMSNFSLDDDADGTLSNTRVFSGLAAGTFSVAETIPSGWFQSSVTCSDGSPVSAIDLAEGENVTCTFTNTEYASLTVALATNPDETGEEFGFSSSELETAVVLTDTTGSDETNTLSSVLTAGTYDVSLSTTPEGWVLDGFSCSDESDPSSVTLGAGEDVTCTATYTKLPNLTIEKVSLPDSGPFDINVTGATTSTFTADLSGDGVDSSDVQLHMTPVGSYTVSEMIPEGTHTAMSCVSTNAGNGADDAVALETDGSVTFNLGAGQHMTCVVNNTPYSVVVGTKIEDANGNGEGVTGTGLSGWPITLYQNVVTPDDPLTEETNEYSSVWNAIDGENTYEGAFGFYNVLPGTYRVCEEMQEGWYQSYPVEGASCSNGTEGYQFTIPEVPEVGAGQTYGGGDNGTYTFGNYQHGSLSGNKFEDMNGDGVWQSPEEPALDGVTIYVDMNGNQTMDAEEPYTVTASGGHYEFLDLEPGTYSIREIVDGDWAQTVPLSGAYAVELSSGEEASAFNFGNIHGGTISGTKWNDLNGDGIWQTAGYCEEADDVSCVVEETLNGVVITLAREGSEDTWTDTTAYGGFYEFTNLLPGTYSVTETPGTGWAQTFPSNPGSHTVALTVGEEGVEHADEVNFGNMEVITLMGAKWNDTDKDGNRDDEGEYGESGMEGWTMTATPMVIDESDEEVLLKTVEVGPSLVEETEGTRTPKTVVTDEYGNYHFDFLNNESGWWRISEEDRAHWTQTYPVSEYHPAYYDVFISSEGPGEYDEKVAGYDEEEGVYEYYDFGNWEWFTVKVFKWKDDNSNGIRDWNDLDEPGNTPGVKDENEGFREDVVSGWPMAVARLIENSEDESEDVSVNVEVVAMALTGANGFAEIRVPEYGNYVVVEGAHPNWNTVYPANHQSLILEPFSNSTENTISFPEGIDSVPLGLDSFFDIFLGEIYGGTVVTEGYATSTGEYSAVPLAFGNHFNPAEVPPTNGGGGSGGPSGSNGPIVGSMGSFFGGGSTGQVLGVSTGTSTPTGPNDLQCSQYINTFMGPGRKNDPAQVSRLQGILVGEGFNVEVNGTFDDKTFEAVKAFQVKYADEILKPWGITDPTGYVYLTTRKKLNEIYCKGTMEFPLTPEEQAIISGFGTGGADDSQGAPAARSGGGSQSGGGNGGSNGQNEGQTGAAANILEDGAIQPGDDSSFFDSVKSFFGRFFR